MIFKRRPAICEPLHLAGPPNAAWDNNFVFSFTRASNKLPLLHEILHLCLGDLAKKVPNVIVKSLHFPILDPERSVDQLHTWYSMLEEHSSDPNVKIVLPDRAFVSVSVDHNIK